MVVLAIDKIFNSNKKQTDTADDLLEAFRIFDPYGEGIVDEKELSDALLNSGDKLTKDEVKEK